jgi:hypothetical protein
MNDDYKLYATDFQESTIIEQHTKARANDTFDVMIYEVINGAFMTIEHSIGGEWEESGIGGGEWINKDESVFEIIDHGIRMDW